MFTFDALVKDVGEWNIENFGNQETTDLKVVSHRGGPVQIGLLVEMGPLAPLLGMVEEIGELAEAITTKNKNDIFDAIGDITIYLCDFCHRSGRPFPVCLAPVCKEEFEITSGLIAYIGRVCHAVLKRHQGIRGMHDDVLYTEALDAALGGLVYELHRYANSIDGSPGLLAIATHTWIKVVRKRNWMQNSVDGGGYTHSDKV